jgi:hypothetical protein
LAATILLELDGVAMFVCDKQSWWVKFQAKSIKPTAQKPHGLDYSLTLHAPDGKRIIGYDNAHTVRRAVKRHNRRTTGTVMTGQGLINMLMPGSCLKTSGRM